MVQSTKDFKDQLLRFAKAVERFNNYRSPEANAEILEVKGSRVLVKMTGVFCVSCGVFDYFEDIAVEADAKVLNYEEIEEGFLVEYELKIS